MESEQMLALCDGDAATLEKFKGCDPALVVDFLQLRKLKGKANWVTRMRAIFRLLDKCTTPALKDECLENVLADGCHVIYERHLPDEMRRTRFVDENVGVQTQGAREFLKSRGVGDGR